MNREDYLSTQTQLVTIATFVRSLNDDDLKAFIEQGQYSMTIGSIFDPTLYMMAGEKLRGVIGIAQAVMRFRKDVEGSIAMIEQGEQTAQAYRAMGINR